MLKILAFVEYFPPRMGSDRRIFEIMSRISKNHRVYFLVYPALRELVGSDTQVTIRVGKKNKESEAMLAGIRGYFLKEPILMSRIWRLSYVIAYFLTAPFFLVQTLRVVARIRPDIFVLNYPSPYTGLLGYLSSRLWRKPVLLDFCDLIAQYIASVLGLKRDSLKSRILSCIQDYLAMKSEKVVVVTRYLRNYLVSRGVQPGKIVLIPNGANIDLFNPCKKYDGGRLKKCLQLPHQKICLYFGRLDEWAGINTLTKLIMHAVDRNLPLSFVLVGSGSMKLPKMKNLIALGEVPYDEMPTILSVADVVVIPFPKTEVQDAASPLKLFEAMAMKKPVIASRVNGIQEVISDKVNGILVDPDNVEDWIKALEYVLKSEESVTQMGCVARRTIETRFNWDYLARKFEAVLCDLCNKC